MMPIVDDNNADDDNSDGDAGVGDDDENDDDDGEKSGAVQKLKWVCVGGTDT